MIDPRPATATAPSFRDTLAGTPYRFIRNLGEGAYGVVVEAEQMALRRAVVVKVLRPTHAAREDLVDRLRLEAQAIAALSPLTPHVVCVLDFGRTPDGRPYIVMEHLEGRSLKEELAERGALPPAEAAEIAVQILEGLAVAHDAGILHRDIKPDNVFLHSGIGGVRMVKLIDFGLAKLVGEARERRGPSPLAKPTDEGVMLGTPRYFAPEQARGDATTASSDLYATGIVLYKMLAGHDPFWRCTNVYDLVRAHLTEVPPAPSACGRSGVPLPLDAVVLKALAKRPEDRHPSARAFRREIEVALGAAARGWSTTERLVPAVDPAWFAAARPSPPLPSEDPSDARTLIMPRPVRRHFAARRALQAFVGLGTLALAAGLMLHRARAPSVLSATPSASVAPGNPR
jgi:serine/threonine-protein kinase